VLYSAALGYFVNLKMRFSLGIQYSGYFSELIVSFTTWPLSIITAPENHINYIVSPDWDLSFAYVLLNLKCTYHTPFH